MRFSQAFIPTQREDPADAEVISHNLMIRAGLLRKVAVGVYAWLPIGLRVLEKVENIVREEMNGIGCLELLMPALQPAELWKQSGRWQAYGDEMVRLKDRHDREFCLGPTHEELITSIAKELRSYKDLPKCLYQIQVKFRDEIRPRFGVMRSREFLMKDAYSFHTDQRSLDETYAQMRQAYGRIVERCGLSYRLVKAASGLIGGAVSEEFMVLAESGEDVVVYCPRCEYAANLETASSRWHIVDDDSSKESIKKKHTPDKSSVNDVASFLGVEPGCLVKTLVFKAGDKDIAALVPGTKELNPTKLAGALGVSEARLRLYTKDDFSVRPDLVSGFVGPVGLKDIKIIADKSLKKMKNFVVGANEVDWHYVDVNIDKDFRVDTFADLVFAEAGESCPECGKGELKQIRGIEVGHIFQLGSKYSDLLNAKYVGENGKEFPFVMGCYGVGVSRLVAAAIEQRNDKQGIIWPTTIAPFDIHMILVGKDDLAKKKAEEIYTELGRSLEVLYDDRKVSAGIKFAEADLLGVPLQVIVGNKIVEKQVVEVKVRADGQRHEIAIDDLVQWLMNWKNDESTS